MGRFDDGLGDVRRWTLFHQPRGMGDRRGFWCASLYLGDNLACTASSEASTAPGARSAGPGRDRRTPSRNTGWTWLPGRSDPVRDGPDKDSTFSLRHWSDLTRPPPPHHKLPTTNNPTRQHQHDQDASVVGVDLDGQGEPVAHDADLGVVHVGEHAEARGSRRGGSSRSFERLRGQLYTRCIRLPPTGNPTKRPCFRSTTAIDEKGLHTVNTPGGPQEMAVVRFYFSTPPGMPERHWVSRPLNPSTGPHGPLDPCPRWTMAIIYFRQLVRTMMAQPPPPPPKPLFIVEPSDPAPIRRRRRGR